MAGWHFRRQQVIDGFIVDFYCAAALIVEVDGSIQEAQIEAEAWRDEALRYRGLCIVRFSTDEVENCFERVLAQIQNAAIEHQAVAGQKIEMPGTKQTPT